MECPTCNGQGTVIAPISVAGVGSGVEGECSECQGTGKIGEPGVCQRCNGSKTVVFAGEDAGIEADCPECSAIEVVRQVHYLFDNRYQ